VKKPLKVYERPICGLCKKPLRPAMNGKRFLGWYGIYNSTFHNKFCSYFHMSKFLERINVAPGS
jgi:hypothetical protein